MNDRAEDRSKAAKIARLRKRVEGMHIADRDLVALLKGILDLLDDEL